MWPNWPWRRNDANKNHDPLRVLELGTWKTIYSGHFRGPVFWSSFFADSQALFIQTFLFPKRQLAVVDLNTGVFTERIDTVTHGWLGFVEATTGRTLLLEDFNTTTHQTETLVQLDLPDYRERMRTPFATQPRMAKPLKGGGMSISADRKILVCAFDDVLLCRRSDDLEILWTRRIDRIWQGSMHWPALPTEASSLLPFPTSLVPPGSFTSLYTTVRAARILSVCPYAAPMRWGYHRMAGSSRLARFGTSR